MNGIETTDSVPAAECQTVLLASSLRKWTELCEKQKVLYLVRNLSGCCFTHRYSGTGLCQSIFTDMLCPEMYWAILQPSCGICQITWYDAHSDYTQEGIIFNSCDTLIASENSQKSIPPQQPPPGWEVLKEERCPLWHDLRLEPAADSSNTLLSFQTG